MKNEKLLNAMENISDDYIEEAAALKKRKKKSRFIAIGSLAACLMMAAIIIPVLSKNQKVENISVGTTSSQFIINVNNIKESTAMSLDMDVECINLLEKMSSDDRQSVLDSFKEATHISYDDFIGRIPADFELTDFHSINTKEAVHDYVFEYSKGDGRITAAVCGFEAPLRDYYFVIDDGSTPSYINDTEVKFYRVNDSYMVEFLYSGAHYDIESAGVSLEDLTRFLAGLLK